MASGLNHASYGPDNNLKYANSLSIHNSKNFGSNQSIVKGYTGPTNSQEAVSSSSPGKIPKIVSGTLNQKGGINSRLVHGSSAYGIALKPDSYGQQVPYSSMYAPIVPRGIDNTQRNSGMGAGKILLPGNLNNYEKPLFKGGRNNRMTQPISSGSMYYSTDINNNMDYSLYSGSGYPPIKGNMSHGDCSRKILVGGFINEPSSENCKSNLNNALWLKNKANIGGKKTVTLKQASSRNAYNKFFRFANQKNGGKKKSRKSRKCKKSRKSRKCKKSRKSRKSKKIQKGGVLGGMSGNPLWVNEYQTSYPPNEINPWPTK